LKCFRFESGGQGFYGRSSYHCIIRTVSVQLPMRVLHGTCYLWLYKIRYQNWQRRSKFCNTMFCRYVASLSRSTKIPIVAQLDWDPCPCPCGVTTCIPPCLSHRVNVDGLLMTAPTWLQISDEWDCAPIMITFTFALYIVNV
jgi:hypothetical protein